MWMEFPVTGGLLKTESGITLQRILVLLVIGYSLKNQRSNTNEQMKYDVNIKSNLCVNLSIALFKDVL
uniref:Uncharacterized protein n=1 Tax=Strongyloides venezuelensis TaxID=75913 RepID=A0A0K0F6X2_STRVS